MLPLKVRGSLPMAEEGEGNKYTQIAALWGVDVTDSSILLLQEFDRRFEELKHETSELKRQNEQWTGVTAQLLEMVGEQKKDAKVLKQDSEKLLMVSKQLSQGLQSCGKQIESQLPTLKQLSASASNHSTKLTSIEAAVSNLENLSGGVTKKIQALGNNLSSPLQGLNARNQLALSAICLLFSMSMLQGVLLIQVRHSLDSANANLNSALIRLKRLEEQ